MPSSKKPRLFLDASVLIAGAASPTGGSAFILKACQQGLFQPVTTALVLSEAAMNITNKLSKKVLVRFYNLIKTLPLEIHPSVISSQQYQDIIDPKDVHVLASAIESQSDYLITLDRQHFLSPKLRERKLPIKIVTPKEFIQAQAKN